MPFDNITTPEVNFIHDTNSLQNLILELICNLQLGEYKNPHEAKERLPTGCLLLVNFVRHDLFQVIKQFKFKTEGNLKTVTIMLPNLRELLNTPLDHFEKLLYIDNDLDAIYILEDHEFARFIYDPIIDQTEHPEAPSWCAFVELLK